MARTLEGSMTGANVEVHKVALTGATAVTLATKFSRILGVFWGWAEEPSNPTYQVYTYSVSGGTATIKCTHECTNDVYVLILGLT